MIRRFFVYWCLIILICSTSLAILGYWGAVKLAEPITLHEPPARGVILLVPLDSRPPCTDYVVKIARMAGFQVLVPPREILDDYRRPANKQAISLWIQQNAAQADAAIISVDMLVHGGLLASRQSTGTKRDRANALDLLKTLHRQWPRLKLYVFNILPRLLISDDPETEKYKSAMAEWSILRDTTTTFENPQDIEKLRTLESSIPSALIDRYRQLYADNRQLNQQLIFLVQTGAISGLLIGQDDSAPFGVANMERQHLDNILTGSPSLLGKVFLARATDEAGLTLLNPATQSAPMPKPKVFVHYTESHTADAILPYMPRPLAQIVEEKLLIANAAITQALTEADFILVIHAGNRQSNGRHLASEAQLIQTWLKSGRQVVVVDLATDWSVEQTLLPHLRRQGVSGPQLLAYAGWNTASNSLGTAITQAVMALRGRTAADESALLFRDVTRVEFLAERLLDDWYYQKIYRHRLNDKLVQKKINPYELKQSRGQVENTIRQQIHSAYVKYIGNEWRNTELYYRQQQPNAYVAGAWSIRSGLPWDRTFEIYVDMQMLPAQVISR